MKNIHKILALILALMMLVSVLAACGEKKDDSKASDAASQADSGDSGSSGGIAGSEQTWGNLTVFVPDTMNFKGGDGTYDPDDQNTAWLNGKEKATDYIKVSIVELEDIAKDSVDTTTEFNQNYNPAEVTLDLDNGQWKGVTYDAGGTTCMTAYAVIGGKVYLVMEAGFATDDETLSAVLKSLK